ncbi:MAG: GNAT family N-acyltransferase [Pseudomonadota bacterium]
MLKNQTNFEQIEVKLAENSQEVEEAQRLRFKVFYEEFGAVPSQTILDHQIDFDDYDQYADHLIVIDHAKGSRVAGTYRLLRYQKAMEFGQFYSSSEYNIKPLLKYKEGLLELGRSCVLEPYRSKAILHILWKGIADYLSDHKIELLFGCASLHGTNIDELSEQLSYLYHFHRSKELLRPVALPDRFVNMNLHSKDTIDVKRVFNNLPPLIKGYLRVGATVGDGAVIDHQFNTTDVCVVLSMSDANEKYIKHYERENNKPVIQNPRVLEEESVIH